MWIARDKSGELYLYNNKPVREDETFSNTTSWLQWLCPRTFPEVTWENSPVEVELKIK